MSMNHVYYKTFMWVKLWLMILCCLTQASGKDMSELENSMVTIIKVFHKYSGHNCKLKKAEFKALINNELSHFIMVSLRIGSANMNQHVCSSILQVTVQEEKDFCLVFTLRISSPQCTSVFFFFTKISWLFLQRMSDKLAQVSMVSRWLIIHRQMFVAVSVSEITRHIIMEGFHTGFGKRGLTIIITIFKQL